MSIQYTPFTGCNMTVFSGFHFNITNAGGGGVDMFMTCDGVKYVSQYLAAGTTFFQAYPNVQCKAIEWSATNQNWIYSAQIWSFVAMWP